MSVTTIVESFHQEHSTFFRNADRWHDGEMADEEFLAFLEEMGRSHFRDEEEILYPAMQAAQNAVKPGLIEDYVAAHQEVWHRIEAIRRWTDEGRPVGGDLRWVVEHIKKHARSEEEVLFPAAERHLGTAKLQELQRQRPQREHRREETPAVRS